MMLLIVGIVLHIVSTSRRRRAYREFPVLPPWQGAGAHEESDMSIHIKNQNAGVINTSTATRWSMAASTAPSSPARTHGAPCASSGMR